MKRSGSSDRFINSTTNNWWGFEANGSDAPAAVNFTATPDASGIGRLYFPLANDSGALSWASPKLHGGLALSYHAQLAPPLTVEDLPQSLVRREFWVAEDGRPPFAASSISPEGLNPDRAAPSTIQAGPGWFAVTRSSPKRFQVTVTLWCPADLKSAVEVMQVEVTNTSTKTLNFIPYAMIPLFARSADNLRDHRHVTALLHRMITHRFGVTIKPTMSFDERGHKLNLLNYGVVACDFRARAAQGIWSVEEEFAGEGGTLAAPAAVWRRQLGPKQRGPRRFGKEAIAGFRFAPQSLKSGQTASFTLLSGITPNPKDLAAWTRFIRKAGQVKRSLKRTQAHWQKIARSVAFSSGTPHLDDWLAWVNVQPTLRRLYGNSYLPQFDYGRGGRGWRDLWQDRLALLLSDPSQVKPTLLHNFGGIRIDGSNATIIGKKGEFIADRNNIPRTWMDHGAWPLHTTLLYVDQTGDVDFLLKNREYFRDLQQLRCRRQDPQWSAAKYGYWLRTRTGKIYKGTLLEHLLIQNLTAFFNVGSHNLCRLEGADWNDGLDMAQKHGESVAFSAFYAWNLRRLAETAQTLINRGHKTIKLAAEVLLLLDRACGGKIADYASAHAKQQVLQHYLETVAKDISGRKAHVPLAELARDLSAKAQDLSGRIRSNEWLRVKEGGFFNGYYDNTGRRVEGLNQSRIHMTLTGQVFPVMSGIATDEQMDKTIASVNRWLRDPQWGGIRLNTDFGGLQLDLGRAFSFAYGEKENGAVFSHMAVMYAFALYLRRRAREGRTAWRSLFEMATRQPTARIFPGLPEYFNGEGRGMYCYLTGSASWLIYLLLTQVFGIRGRLGDLIIDPQLTRDDFGSKGQTSVQLHFAGRPLVITIENKRRLDAGRYRIQTLRHGRRALPFTPDAAGGIRIARKTIQRLPAKTPAHLWVGVG